MVEQEFKEYAPRLESVKVTKAECDNIVIKERVLGNKEPVLIKEKALVALQGFIDLEENGLLSIAQEAGLSLSQVKQLHKEFLLSKNPPEKVVVVEPEEEESIKE